MVSKQPSEYLTVEELFAKLDEPSPWKARPGVYAARAGSRLRDLKLSILRGWQRWRRGYSEQDTWSFDTFLSPVILGGLTRLRDREFVHPGRYSPETWHERLDTMIAGFTVAATTDVWDMTEEDHATFQRGAAIFIEDYFDLWD